MYSFVPDQYPVCCEAACEGQSNRTPPQGKGYNLPMAPSRTNFKGHQFYKCRCGDGYRWKISRHFYIVLKHAQCLVRGNDPSPYEEAQYCREKNEIQQPKDHRYYIWERSAYSFRLRVEFKPYKVLWNYMVESAIWRRGYRCPYTSRSYYEKGYQLWSSLNYDIDAIQLRGEVLYELTTGVGRCPPVIFSLAPEHDGFVARINKDDCASYLCAEGSQWRPQTSDKIFIRGHFVLERDVIKWTSVWASVKAEVGQFFSWMTVSSGISFTIGSCDFERIFWSTQICILDEWRGSWISDGVDSKRATIKEDEAHVDRDRAIREEFALSRYHF